ncbi:MAG: hypothetical protein HOP23_14625 [Methylococcaceae bacterium]|nr:hypothetical protein [Methylococcaceae bacterium]
MAAKKKSTPRNLVEVPAKKDENFDDAIARTLTRPEISAALTIQKWQGEVSEVNALARSLVQSSLNMLDNTLF